MLDIGKAGSRIRSCKPEEFNLGPLGLAIPSSIHCLGPSQGTMYRQVGSEPEFSTCANPDGLKRSHSAKLVPLWAQPLCFDTSNLLVSLTTNRYNRLRVV